MQFSTRLAPALVAIALLGACSTPKPIVYTGEQFDSTDIFARRFPVSQTVACEAVRRALLSQGYVISIATADQVDGRKSFQPDNDVHVQIAFRVVCAVDAANGNISSVFVNALEDRYALKKVNTAASLGVGVLGSVSLPFSSSDDSLVKVASQTVGEEKFYSRFFQLVERYLTNEAVPAPEMIELSTPK